MRRGICIRFHHPTVTELGTLGGIDALQKTVCPEKEEGQITKQMVVE